MRSTYSEINLENIKNNLEIIRKRTNNASIISVVKANAYGHCMLEVAKTLRSAQVEMLGVAFAEEGEILRTSGDKGDILVIIPIRKQDVACVCNNKLAVAISSLEVAKQLNQEAQKHNLVIHAHLFINTGMNRDGIKPTDAQNFLKVCKDLKHLNIIGLMSHFATSDCEDKTFAHKQLDVFTRTKDALEAVGHSFKYIHIANSAGIINIENSIFNTVRPGIFNYGYMPEKRLLEGLKLSPSLELKSEVIHINQIKSGDTAGYGLRYMADCDHSVAIVPIGYGDGYSRAHSGISQVLIAGKRYDIIGTVCMDEILIDIKNDVINIGDEVVLIGKQGREEVTIYELAANIKTIPYEITSALTKRIPRICI